MRGNSQTVVRSVSSPELSALYSSNWLDGCGFKALAVAHNSIMGPNGSWFVMLRMIWLLIVIDRLFPLRSEKELKVVQWKLFNIRSVIWSFRYVWKCKLDEYFRA